MNEALTLHEQKRPCHYIQNQEPPIMTIYTTPETTKRELEEKTVAEELGKESLKLLPLGMAGEY